MKAPSSRGGRTFGARGKGSDSLLDSIDIAELVAVMIVPQEPSYLLQVVMQGLLELSSCRSRTF